MEIKIGLSDDEVVSLKTYKNLRGATSLSHAVKLLMAEVLDMPRVSDPLSPTDCFGPKVDPLISGLSAKILDALSEKPHSVAELTERFDVWPNQITVLTKEMASRGLIEMRLKEQEGPGAKPRIWRLTDRGYTLIMNELKRRELRQPKKEMVIPPLPRLPTIKLEPDHPFFEKPTQPLAELILSYASMLPENERQPWVDELFRVEAFFYDLDPKGRPYTTIEKELAKARQDIRVDWGIRQGLLERDEEGKLIAGPKA